MEIVATQDHESFFEDYVKEILSSSTLPPSEQKFGSVHLEWWEEEPRTARVYVEGGYPADRELAQLVLAAQLEGAGYKLANERISSMQRYANWQEVMQKAKRLLQSGSVQLLRNGYNTVVGHVKGDHGDYQTELSRDDPNSKAITYWHCPCPWGQFSWGRTRRWKRYEGRPCSHILSTYWKSLGTPLDEDISPYNNEPQGGQGGQLSLFPNGEQPSQTAEPQAPGSLGPQVPSGQGPRTFSPEEPAPGQAPENNLIPQAPTDPRLQPGVNPVSVPGLRPPSPLNPIQNPSTFSSVYTAFENGQMVSLKREDVGTAVGRSEEHGAGQPWTIPANSVGEVLGQDPTTGMVQVYFAGPCKDNGPMEPHGVVLWAFPSELANRTDVRPPGPAIRRRSGWEIPSQTI